MAARNAAELKSLNTELERFSKFDKEKLISRPEWGAISLEDTRPDFDKIYEVANYLKVLPLENLTPNALSTIRNELHQINNLFDSIEKFSITTANPVEQRNQFAAQIHARTDTFYNQATPWIPFLAFQRGDVTRNIEALTAAVTEGRKIIDSAKTDIEKKSKEIDDIIVKAREASAAAGAAVFTKDFQRESTELKGSAKNWLIFTGVLSGLTLAAAVIMWCYADPGLDSGQLIHKLGTKLAILTILLSGTVWCGRIYKALMHQSTIYRHRALSIQTLQAFSSAVEDVHIKDAVVLEATKAVFGNVATGYINPSGSSGEHDVKIVEMAKCVFPKKDG